MTKLKLPVSPLFGAPLTDEELKSILGGQVDYTRKCICTLTHASGNASGSGSGSGTNKTQHSLGAGNEYVCQSRCSKKCDETPTCISSSYTYIVTG